MKRLFAIILMTTMVICLTACDKSQDAVSEPATEEAATEEQKEEPAAEAEEPVSEPETSDQTDEVETPEDTDTEEAEAEGSSLDINVPLLFINSEPVVVSAKDGFDNAGFSVFYNDTPATYSFTSSSKDITWTIFLLDEEFEDAVRYIPQAFEPALEGDGTLEIEAGKYIYIQCSENGFTADEPSDETLSIGYEE